MSVDLLNVLVGRIGQQRRGLDRLDAYFAGLQPLAFLHPEIEALAGDRLFSLAINWPRVIVTAVEERLDVEGFRLGRDRSADRELWDVWQANDLDEWSQMLHVDAMVHGRAYATVWGRDDEDGIPRIAVESARQMTVTYLPGTRDVAAAAKVWRENTSGSGVDSLSAPLAPGEKILERAVLYLPDRIEHYEREARHGDDPNSSVLPGVREWQLARVVANPLGEVPVVPYVNRPRLTDLTGESELTDVLPLADAINKLATDMMVASEYHAMPRRWVTGLEIPREGTKQKQMADDAREKWQEAFPGKPWFAGPGVNFGQFTEATLDNFVAGIRMLTAHIAAIAGLPPHYLGLSTDNPASADAIRSAETSLIKTAERKQRGFGGSHERTMRLALKVIGRDLPEGVRSMETIWRDPATPTPAQKADHAVKLTQGERPIITIRQARQDLGYSPTEIGQMERDDAATAATAATAEVEQRIAIARRLQADGMDEPAAFAAAGLIAASQALGAPAVPPALPAGAGQQ